MILIAQSPPVPMPVPDGAPLYPVFDVSLESPLPSANNLISTTLNFVFPPFLGLVSALLGVIITKAIIKSFQNK